ncbi:MAG: MarR family transcriptional regulator [Candidatus Marinimicrobia bacterium]|nr:MarR family transcriptional regulator [Candidatus Neomarinimicrobiota bacterium]MDD5708915.1 MarR family transcriptional regulator [Candidatus Neomarinimicrobiota bacterium]MDX9777763.1 MarR family transcriptional regulator [bacterium]
MKNSEKYEAHILRSLRRITRAVDIYSRKLNERYGLTTPQYLCLEILSDSGAIILKDLARAANLGESTVNGIADRLESKGFVERKRSGDDRRKVYLELTAAGREMIRSTPPLLQNKLSAFISTMSVEEQHCMTDALERVADILETEQWMQ